MSMGQARMLSITARRADVSNVIISGTESRSQLYIDDTLRNKKRPKRNETLDNEQSFMHIHKSRIGPNSETERVERIKESWGQRALFGLMSRDKGVGQLLLSSSS